MQRLFIALIALSSLVPSASYAQPSEASERWLVIPAGASEAPPEEAVRLVAAATGALAERGRTIVVADELLSLGADPAAFPQTLEVRLVGTVESATEDVAFGRYSRVFEEVGPLLDEVRDHLSALGTRPDAVRAVSDLSLILARAHAESRDEAAARATVERLLSLVPRPDPSPRHPRTALALLERAQARLGAGEEDGRLRVGAADGDCNAFLNGQLLGPTPREVPLYSGTYAVRVQCGDVESRVHMTQVERGVTEIEIVASVEDALERHPLLHLRYEDAAERAARSRSDAATLARIGHAPRALLLTIEGAEARLESLDVGQDSVSVVATNSLPLSPPPSRDALLASWSVVIDGVSERTSDDDDSGGPSVWDYLIGAGFMAAGAAALVSPIHTVARLGECTDRVGVGACQTHISFGLQSGILSAVGVAALAVGITWWVVAPLRISVSADATSGRVSLEGRF